ncbi:MAG: hypothetical protein AAFV53_36680, partial [Myxococcota bacterium]
MLANAWSPSLLTTKEAFGLYLDRLTDDGVLSMTDLRNTRWLALSAIAALKDRGVENPQRHIAYIAGPHEVFLLRPRPWTDAEVERLTHALKTQFRNPLVLNPGVAVDDPVRVLRYMPAHLSVSPATSKPSQPRPPGVGGGDRPLQGPGRAQRSPNGPGKIGKRPGGGRPRPAAKPPPPQDKEPPLEPPTVRTDDHPYQDSPKRAIQMMQRNTFPDGMLYRTLLAQGSLVLLFGGVVIGVPMLGPGRREITGELPALGYVACLGVGYLSVETVLLYNLTLFVGHPTYTIATVVFSMLVFSGLGSVFADRGPDEAVAGRLQAMLAATLALGLLQAFMVVGWMTEALITLPLWVRVLAAGASLAPLSFVMGTCFPYGMRLVTPRAPRLVAWAWAVNGWMSVLGGLLTVLIARTLGYSAAMLVALSAYAVALALVGRMRGTAQREHPHNTAGDATRNDRHQVAK